MINPDKLFGRLGNRLFHMAYLHAQFKEGIIPDMYIQDYRLFEKHADSIKEWFSKDIGFLPHYVGVHIRRGDYVNNPFYVDLTQTTYYEDAMALFPNKKFLVFSDDPLWCCEKFKDNVNVQVMEGGTDIEDFNMLASCEHQIIANSSFSWWAAYLNPNFGKTVVAPLQWHTDGVTRTIIPPTWTQI